MGRDLGIWLSAREDAAGPLSASLRGLAALARSLPVSLRGLAGPALPPPADPIEGRAFGGGAAGNSADFARFLADGPSADAGAERFSPAVAVGVDRTGFGAGPFAPTGAPAQRVCSV